MRLRRGTGSKYPKVLDPTRRVELQLLRLNAMQKVTKKVLAPTKRGELQKRPIGDRSDELRTWRRAGSGGLNGLGQRAGQRRSLPHPDQQDTS
jgi:hypothetical protein